MATRIIEYGNLIGNAPTIIPSTTKVTAQAAMTATGTSAQSAAFSDATSVVCIQSDEAIYAAFGSNPTATANDYRIQAGGEQFFHVSPSWKVAIRT